MTGREDHTVQAVIDADPQLSIQAVINVLDVLFGHGITSVCFTECGEPDSATPPPPGLHVYGRPIKTVEGLEGPEELPRVSDHPALSRLIELR